MLQNAPNTSNSYHRWLYVLVVFLAVIAGLYLSGWIYGLLQACSNIVVLYFTAWLLQFFFTPVVDFLVRRRLPRALAVGYVYLVLTLVFAVVLIAVVPRLYAQINDLVGQLSRKGTYVFVTNFITSVEQTLEHRFNVPQKDIDTFNQSYGLGPKLQDGVVKLGGGAADIIRRFLTPSSILSNATALLSALQTLSNFLINLVIVLILTFYMTLDGHKLMRRALSYFPPVAGEIMLQVQPIINRKFGGYIRGQLILAASYGILTYAIAIGFDLPYQVAIALFAAIMMLIPFIGTYAALVPPLTLYILQNPATFPIGKFVLLLVFLIASQQVVINFLSPRVMSGALGMHPLLVVLGVLLGTKVAGLWGAIFGVPVFGVLVDTADLIYRRVMDQRYGFHPPALDQLDGDDGSPPTPGDNDDSPYDVPTERVPVVQRSPSPLTRAGALLRRPAPRRDTQA